MRVNGSYVSPYRLISLEFIRVYTLISLSGVFMIIILGNRDISSKYTTTSNADTIFGHSALVKTGRQL